MDCLAKSQPPGACAGHGSRNDKEGLAFSQSPPAGRLLSWRVWQLQQGVHLGTVGGLEFINSTNRTQETHKVLFYSVLAQEALATALGKDKESVHLIIWTCEPWLSTLGLYQSVTQMGLKTRLPGIKKRTRRWHLQQKS